jgi:predicted NBD/HSP70 family sugar kinase
MVDISQVNPVRTIGTSDLFQILRDGQPRTRAELATVTGLARSTVALRVDALMRMGLISPTTDAASTGGRPSSQFRLDARSKVVLGIDIGASHVRIALSDLSGNPILEDSAAMEIALGPEPILQWVAEVGTALIERSGRSPHDLLAVGIGLPGPVDHNSGRPVNPPIMPGWDGFDVPGRLTAHFGVPVLVDNDVNIMALGERQLAWPGVDHLIFVKVATGIGAGVISDGRLQRGAEGIAGDIGHVKIARDSEALCRCGNKGCLEALASGRALAQALRDRGLSAEKSADVVDLVKSGNLDAVPAVRQAGRDIGEVLTTCISLMNPSVIVIGGSMAQAGEHLLAGVREVIYTRSMPLATQHLQIVQATTGSGAATVGAAMLAIQFALSPGRIEAMAFEGAPHQSTR